MLRRSLFRLIAATGRFIQFQVSNLVESYSIKYPSQKPLRGQFWVTEDDNGQFTWVSIPLTVESDIDRFTRELENIYEILKGELLLNVDLIFSDNQERELEPIISESSLIIEIGNVEANSLTNISKVATVTIVPIQEGTETIQYLVHSGKQIIDVPRTLSSYRISITPESGIQSLNLKVWSNQLMATFKQVVSQSNLVASVSQSVSNLNSQVATIDAAYVRQVRLSLNTVLEANGTYGYPHCIIAHNLGEWYPTVDFYNDQDEAEMLAYKAIDENQIVVDVSDASGTINSNWAAIFKGVPIQTTND